MTSMRTQKEHTLEEPMSMGRRPIGFLVALWSKSLVMDVPAVSMKRTPKSVPMVIMGGLQGVQEEALLLARHAGILGHERHVVAGGREVDLAEEADAENEETCGDVRQLC